MIADNALYDQYGLTELTVPEGATKIWYSAFSGCEKLREITLPASMEEIGNYAFEYSRELLIKAPAGSWAQKYSEENGYRFEAVGSVAETVDAEPVLDPRSAHAVNEKECGLYRYKEKADGTAEITGVNDESVEILEIPASRMARSFSRVRVSGRPASTVYSSAPGKHSRIHDSRRRKVSSGSAVGVPPPTYRARRVRPVPVTSGAQARISFSRAFI